MQLLYAIIVFAYVKGAYILSSENKGCLAWNWGIISIKLPQREALIYKLFKMNASVWGNFTEKHLSLERMDIWYRMSFYLRDHGFNPDQHPNLIALSLTFDERVTRVEVSVCLLSLKHLLHLHVYVWNKHAKHADHFWDYPKEKHFSLHLRISATTWSNLIVLVCKFSKSWLVSPLENVTKTTSTNSTCQIFNTGQCHC